MNQTVTPTILDFPKNLFSRHATARTPFERNTGSPHVIEHWLKIIEPDGNQDVYKVARYETGALAENLRPAEPSFRQALSSICQNLDRLLEFDDDEVQLEHHAILFWPTLATLHKYLGSEPRADEIISACDSMRVEFRLKPVTATTLRALATGLQTLVSKESWITDDVDDFLDELEAAGTDPRFPLTFEDDAS